MDNIKKICVCHWYFNSNVSEFNPIEKFHLFMLSLYRNVFDEIIFGIAINDDNDASYVSPRMQIVKDLLGEDKVKYYVHKNDIKRGEYVTYYNHVLPLIDNKCNCYVFYCHFKGMGCHIDDYINVLFWSYLMYKYNLDNDYLPFNEFSDNHKFFSGTFVYNHQRYYEYLSRTFSCKEGQENKLLTWHYSGTFYWINCLEVNKKHPDLRNTFPIERVKSYYFIERFPGILCDKDEINIITHDWWPLYEMYHIFDIMRTVLLRESNDYMYILLKLITQNKTA